MLKLKDLKEIIFGTEINIYDTNTKLGFDEYDLSDRSIKKFGEYEVVGISPSYKEYEKGGISIYINFFDKEELEKCIYEELEKCI